MDCVLHYKADTRGAALTGGGVQDSPGMRAVKEDAACEAYLVHVANFPEVLWGGVCLLVYKLLSRCGSRLCPTSGALKNISYRQRELNNFSFLNHASKLF